MKKQRTVIDSGVLIAAVRGTDELAERALEVLDDPARSFVSSDLVRLEVTPKAVYHGQEAEAAFYETFFGQTRRLVTSSAKLVSEAELEPRADVHEHERHQILGGHRRQVARVRGFDRLLGRQLLRQFGFGDKGQT